MLTILFCNEQPIVIKIPHQAYYQTQFAMKHLQPVANFDATRYLHQSTFAHLEYTNQGKDRALELSANDIEKMFNYGCYQLLSEQTESDSKINSKAAPG